MLEIDQRVINGLRNLSIGAAAGPLPPAIADAQTMIGRRRMRANIPWSTAVIPTVTLPDIYIPFDGNNDLTPQALPGFTLDDTNTFEIDTKAYEITGNVVQNVSSSWAISSLLFHAISTRSTTSDPYSVNMIVGVGAPQTGTELSSFLALSLNVPQYVVIFKLTGPTSIVTQRCIVYAVF